MNQVDWDELGPRLCDHLAAVYTLSRHAERLFPSFAHFTQALSDLLASARDDITAGMGDQSEVDVFEKQMLRLVTSKGPPQ